ncbi:hypothetical protein OROMI_016666 [Orobanche minor]
MVQPTENPLLLVSLHLFSTVLNRKRFPQPAIIETRIYTNTSEVCVTQQISSDGGDDFTVQRLGGQLRDAGPTMEAGPIGLYTATDGVAGCCVAVVQVARTVAMAIHVRFGQQLSSMKTK